MAIPFRASFPLSPAERQEPPPGTVAGLGNTVAAWHGDLVPVDHAVNVLLLADDAEERAVVADARVVRVSPSLALAQAAQRRSRLDKCRSVLAAAEALLAGFDPAWSTSRDITLPRLGQLATYLAAAGVPDAGSALVASAVVMSPAAPPGEPLRRLAAVLRSAGDDAAALAGYAKYLGVQVVSRTPVVARSTGTPEYDAVRTQALARAAAARRPDAAKWTHPRALADLLPVHLADPDDLEVKGAVAETVDALRRAEPAAEHNVARELRKLTPSQGDTAQTDSAPQRVLYALGRTFARQAGIAWADVPAPPGVAGRLPKGHLEQRSRS